MSLACRKNGRIGEIAALGYSRKEILDGDLGGVPIEVKSAQFEIKNGTGRHGEGRQYVGRFKLLKYQHEVLLQKGGDYIFCLINRGRVIEKVRLSAQVVEDRFSVSSKEVTRIAYPLVIPSPFYR